MKRRWIKPVILFAGAIAALFAWVVFDAHGRSLYHRLPDLYQHRDVFYLRYLALGVRDYYAHYGAYPKSLDDPEVLVWVESVPGPDLSLIEYVPDPESSTTLMRYTGTYVQHSWVPLVPPRTWTYLAETDEEGRFVARWVE